MSDLQRNVINPPFIAIYPGATDGTDSYSDLEDEELSIEMKKRLFGRVKNFGWVSIQKI